MYHYPPVNPPEPERSLDGTYVGVFRTERTAIHVDWQVSDRRHPLAVEPPLPVIPEPPSDPPDYWFTDTAPPTPAQDRGGPWHLLLLVPVSLSLATPLYNRLEPRLFGMPFFYWGQLAFVVLSIAVVTLVYQVTKVSR